LRDLDAEPPKYDTSLTTSIILNGYQSEGIGYTTDILFEYSKFKMMNPTIVDEKVDLRNKALTRIVSKREPAHFLLLVKDDEFIVPLSGYAPIKNVIEKGFEIHTEHPGIKEEERRWKEQGYIG
jgi:hypothetical protein